jgi:hypothetical protein
MTRINEELIKSDFDKIKSGGLDGYHPTSKPENTDGGHGNTFEKLFRVDENNLKKPDYLNFEIKAKAIFDNKKSNITLSSRAPDFPPTCGVYLRDRYGHIKPEDGLKRLYATLRGVDSSKKSAWTHVHVTKTHVPEDKKFYMKIQLFEDEKKMKILIKDYNFKSINDEIYWTFDSIEEWIGKIKDQVIGICSDKKIINDLPHFYYDRAHVFWGLRFDKFIEHIKLGNIVFDFRYGVYKEEHRRGKLHDRGSCLRLKESEWLETCKDLYSEYLCID